MPSPEMVEKRAREIALIDERDPDEFTDADWAQAVASCSAKTTPSPPEEDSRTSNLKRNGR